MLTLILTLCLSPAWAGKYASLADELELTAAERAKVEDIVYQYRIHQTEHKATLKKAKLELRHALGAEALDEKAIAGSVDAVNVATAHLVKARVDQIIALRKTLTPTQWTELKARWAEEEEDEEEDDD